MYPVLETERLILKPLHENDFEDIFKLLSNPDVVNFMEGDVWDDPVKYKEKFMRDGLGGNTMSVRLKENDKFIGFIGMHQYISKMKSEIKYSQTWTAFFPEYWGQGFCTEATEKILHFAFLGIKTPWICANQFQINPVAGNVLRKCGFSFYKTYTMQKGVYNQFRYYRKNYIKNNNIDTIKEELAYNYNFPLSKSPYSYGSPVRKIVDITYIKEPTSYLCGQSVIAMLANVSVDEVIGVMETDKGTSIAAIDEALCYYGIKHGKTRKSVKEDTILPEICILSLQLPGYGHWSLYYKGTYYDPEFGVSDKLPQKAKLTYYWKINS